MKPYPVNFRPLSRQFLSVITMASAAKIPIIDISATGQEEQLQVAKELVDAAVEHGFVYIKNTGADISADAVENAFRLVRCPNNPLDTPIRQTEHPKQHL